ncbi:hypothetical protein PIROE2DRAFT_9661 [Piromyces sp. E2]|nr:hypothetical protein PIROE2DRAFT_9661 [Piromyces sp. E2]|eukprot:OUM63723.1 hypothetical protein PIROE2DRAFT_9661 [Piromyces sp. E2]
MKLSILYLLTGTFVYLSRSQDIIKPTNYTIDYLETLDMSKLTCKFDTDCPEYSKCVKSEDGSKSFCKFGSFLCPKKIKDRFMSVVTNDNCIFVNTNIWDLDREKIIKEDFKKNTADDNLILKTCPRIINDKNALSCYTDPCDKDDDCFSGMCQSHKCVLNDKVDHYIYRCTGNDNKVKCGKHYGMMCGSNDNCYSSHCNRHFCTYKSREEINHQHRIYDDILYKLNLIFNKIKNRYHKPYDNDL